MQGSFYSNCAVLTYAVDGDSFLVSENSVVTEIECDGMFEVISPPTFISGSEVTYEGRRGCISSIGEKYADVIFDSELRRVKITKLTTHSDQERTIIRGNTIINERLKEMCWKGRGKILVQGDDSILSFHVRLISSLPYPVTFSSIKIHDRGFQDQVPVFTMARSVSRRSYDDDVSLTPPQDNETNDEITHTLDGPITLNSMFSTPVMNVRMNITAHLMYDFLNNYSFVLVYGKYKGEIYRGNYTVVVPEYGITQSCNVSPNPQKSFTLNLRDNHCPYSITREITDQSDNGYKHEGKVTNISKKKIYVYFVTMFRNDYTYTPENRDHLPDSNQIYWGISLGPGVTKSYSFIAGKLVDGRYSNQ